MRELHQISGRLIVPDQLEKLSAYLKCTHYNPDQRIPSPEVAQALQARIDVWNEELRKIRDNIAVARSEWAVFKFRETNDFTVFVDAKQTPMTSVDAPTVCMTMPGGEIRLTKIYPGESAQVDVAYFDAWVLVDSARRELVRRISSLK